MFMKIEPRKCPKCDAYMNAYGSSKIDVSGMFVADVEGKMILTFLDAANDAFCVQKDINHGEGNHPFNVTLWVCPKCEYEKEV